MQKLWKLLLAYIRKLPKAPHEEKANTPTQDVIEVPLGLRVVYYERAKEKTLALQPRRQLTFLQQCDEEERTQWADAYHHSERMLGQCVSEVFHRRQALWEVPPPSVLRDLAVGGANHDVSQPSGRKAIREEMEKADATIGAVDCGTYSRVREVHQRGRGTAPPCRSTQHPEAFPGGTPGSTRGSSQAAGPDTAQRHSKPAFIDSTHNSRGGIANRLCQSLRFLSTTQKTMSNDIVGWMPTDSN